MRPRLGRCCSSLFRKGGGLPFGGSLNPGCSRVMGSGIESMLTTSVLRSSVGVGISKCNSVQ